MSQMTLFPFIFFSLGLIMIIKGSDLFIDAVIWIAKITKIPDLIIGATLVSLGTTLPELMVSVGAAVQQNTDIAIGNALGSIICNTGLILSIIIIVSRPQFKEKRAFQRKGILLSILLILVFLLGLIYGEISRISGFLLLGVLVWYLFTNVNANRPPVNDTFQAITEKQEINKNILLKNILMFIFGLFFTVYGSRLLIQNGEKIAVFLGVPDIVIGLTMTALGTSLPELMTAITSLRKEAQDLSMGNILGANILNIILVIAASATVSPIPIESNVLRFHLPFGFLIVFAAITFSYISQKYFRRRYGLILLFSYSFYVLLTFGLFGS